MDAIPDGNPLSTPSDSRRIIWYTLIYEPLNYANKGKVILKYMQSCSHVPKLHIYQLLKSCVATQQCMQTKKIVIWHDANALQEENERTITYMCYMCKYNGTMRMDNEQKRRQYTCVKWNNKCFQLQPSLSTTYCSAACEWTMNNNMWNICNIWKI